MGWEGIDPIRWAAKMKDAPRDTINIFAFSVFNRVVERTPVDTGQARSNWLVSINQEDDRKLMADVKYKKVRHALKDENGNVIKGTDGKIKRKTVTRRSVKLEQSAKDTVRVGHLAINSAEGDDKIIIQNNLPYIRRLEYGHSKKQAPHGMVGVVMAMAERLWNAAVKAARGGKG